MAKAQGKKAVAAGKKAAKTVVARVKSAAGAAKKKVAPKKSAPPPKPAAKKAAPKPAPKPVAKAKPAKLAKPAKPVKAAKKGPVKAAKAAAKAVKAAAKKVVAKVTRAAKPKAAPAAKKAAPAKAPTPVKVAPAKAAAPTKPVASAKPAAPAKAAKAAAPAKSTALKVVPKTLPPAEAKPAAPAPVAAPPAAPAPAAEPEKAKRGRRARPRVISSGAPAASWLTSEKPRAASFIPAPARAEAPSAIAAPPASSDRLLRPEDTAHPAVRTVPVRIDIEQGAGRFYVIANPMEVTVKQGEGIEWDFRYIGGSDVTVEEIWIEFEKPSPFTQAVFRTPKPGGARPHRQLSEGALPTAAGKRVQYTIRAMTPFKTELASTKVWVTITP